MKYVFILGASDPEMAAIEVICKENGYPIIYASYHGKRVNPGNAYQANRVNLSNFYNCIPVWVECRSDSYRDWHIVIDHHRDGDPGFGLPPAEYWLGSSIGQFCKLVGHERTDELSIIAAADHCLGHAYRGKCPTVSPDMLRNWRAKTRAAFQRISIEQLEENVRFAVAKLKSAPRLKINQAEFIDARKVEVKEFAEAAAILGESVIYEIYDSKSKRMKAGVLGGSPEDIHAWMDWSSAFLVDCYGDAERGYAGGYRS